MSFLRVLVAFACFASGQDSGFRADFAQADAQLNNDYKRSFGTLAAPTQDAIRRAERAWVNFSDKEKTLVNTLQNENLLPQEFAHAHIVVEMGTRSNHLETFFISHTVPTSASYILNNLDQALTKTYGECMRRLGESDQNLLRESERAWIAYRDADARAMKMAYTSSNESICIAALVHLTAMRTAQLKAIVQSVTPAAITNPFNQEALSTPVQNNSQNLEESKAVAALQSEAKMVLNTLLARKDDSFFKKAEAIRNCPDLPAAVADQISKLDSKFAEVSQKWNGSTLLEPAGNEYAVVKLLAVWSKFKLQLKDGSVSDSDTTLRKALTGKPKNITLDYQPIWQAVEDWQDVCAKVETEFRAHVEKAKFLAASGKTSEAIKEYQIAYDIFADSSISEKIKKLREQSLGL